MPCTDLLSFRLLGWTRICRSCLVYLPAGSENSRKRSRLLSNRSTTSSLLVRCGGTTSSKVNFSAFSYR
ncbi:hypothetical protein PISMIDRAFT_672843 [Pisolithus microcarpus 441]|uniref:Uncharacterized protein n=1 Tax=Pisolithus microcarpus 441 TaxID=765257 RepID=A0A0D0A9P0_9AGAM|nr:hypothetical protein PISMIDRAFT_672843 [Pisolithus microcarpus 441]